MTAVTYRRIQHAAHYAYGDPRKGHDLETWDVTEDPADPLTRNRRGEPVAPEGVPRDAPYHSGYLLDGVSHHSFVRTAPMTGTCARCEALRM